MLSGSISSSISCIYRYIQKIERIEMEYYGLKGPYPQCLLAMRRYPEGITAARLCEVCDKDKAAVSRMVAELEEKGLITRSDLGVRYRMCLKLTKLGEEAAEHVGLTDAQRATMDAGLDLLAGNLQEICVPGLK